jgi:quercetin dioxygenase-like cupin family protein
MAGELKPAEALNLADQVEYAEGSVVSRTILQKQVGTLTLFAFDQGQGLSEHSAPFDALVQVLDGEAEITIGRKPIRTKAGQTVLMPANVPHALKATSRFKMLLTMIRSE